jgi:hypothetical protein
VRKGAQFLEPAIGRALNEEFDDLCAYPEAPCVPAHDERSYFGDIAVERGQLTATDHSILVHRNEEAMHVRLDFLQATGQEVPIFEVLGYKRVDVRRIVGPGSANVNARFEDG